MVVKMEIGISMIQTSFFFLNKNNEFYKEKFSNLQFLE